MKRIAVLIVAGALSFSAEAQVFKKNPDVVKDEPVVVTTPQPTGSIFKKKRVVVNEPVVTSDDRYRNRRNLPPGQAKKLYGAKSARDFAPGHQKKNKRWDKDDRDERVIFGNGNSKNRDWKRDDDRDDDDKRYGEEKKRKKDRKDRDDED